MELSDIQAKIVLVLDEQLKLNGHTDGFTADTRLLGGLPHLDSLGVVGVVSGLEKTFGFRIEDDEIDGSMFETIGSLSRFVRDKIQNTK